MREVRKLMKKIETEHHFKCEVNDFSNCKDWQTLKIKIEDVFENGRQFAALEAINICDPSSLSGQLYRDKICEHFGIVK